jgi:hypothetical protein
MGGSRPGLLVLVVLRVGLGELRMFDDAADADGGLSRYAELLVARHGAEQCVDKLCN